MEFEGNLGRFLRYWKLDYECWYSTSSDVTDDVGYDLLRESFVLITELERRLRVFHMLSDLDIKE